MSGQFSIVQAKAAGDPRLTHAVFRVLAVLGTYADHESGWCWPKQSTIAEAAGMDQPGVSRCIAQLVDLGYVEIGQNTGRGKSYRLVHDHPQPRDAMTVEQTCADDMAAMCSSHSQGTNPKNDSLNVKRVLTNPVELSLDGDGRDPVVVVFEAWRETTGKDRAVLDQKRRRLIQARLTDGYTTADLVTAVGGWRYSPHHRGENERNTVYNDLGLLLRDSDHVDRMIEFAQRGNGGGSSRTMGTIAAVVRRMS
jgi:hypothetical protein